MRDTARYSTVPEDADMILFAEDFVNHILFKLDLPLLASGIADHRAVIHNAFNSEVRLGANYVYRCLEEEMSQEFDNILKHNNIDVNSFLKYVIPLKFHLSMIPDEPGAVILMHFCVKISTIAAKFYIHGFLDAPVLAVDYILSVINDTEVVDGGWDELNTVATGYAQFYIDMDNYLTPESASDYEWESDSLSTLSSKSSEKSRSPDPEIEGGDDQDEHPELTEDDYCNLCIAALRSPSGEPVSSSSDGKSVEKTSEAKAGSIASSSDSATDSVSSGSSKEKRSFHSSESTSSEDDSSKQNIRKKRSKKTSCSCSKESENDSEKCEADLKTADHIDPFGGLLTERRSSILSSPINEFHKSDSAHHFKSSSSDNLTTEDTNASLTEKGDRVKSPRKIVHNAKTCS